MKPIFVIIVDLVQEKIIVQNAVTGFHLLEFRRVFAVIVDSVPGRITVLSAAIHLVLRNTEHISVVTADSALMQKIV